MRGLLLLVSGSGGSMASGASERSVSPPPAAKYSVHVNQLPDPRNNYTRQLEPRAEAQCEAACDAEAGCVGFTQRTDPATYGDPRPCWLYSSAPRLMNSPDADYFQKPGTPPIPAPPAPPPTPPAPGSLPVVITPGPYNVTFARANGNEPFISSHFPPGHDGHSAFNFNLVPAFLTLPSGHDALIVRSVNGTTWDTAKNGTTSTTINPDKLTLTTYIGSSSDMDSVKVSPIVAESVILEPVGPREACGVQDPRIVYNEADETFYMTYCVYGPPLPKDPKTNPLGISCGGAGVGIATTKTPQVPASWVRHGYNCNDGKRDNCGKSAAILIRESGPHYMFWGIPTIAVSVSDDLLHWTLTNSSWVVPDAGAQEMWVEAGSPPERLSDGNYIMSYNIADGDLWWGIGYLILDKDDPTKILQRESRSLWPTEPWERADPSDPATSWEYYRNCIGAMNSLHPLPTPNEFVGFYVGGDSVSGAARITVTKSRAD